LKKPESSFVLGSGFFRPTDRFSWAKIEENRPTDRFSWAKFDWKRPKLA